MGKTSDNIHVYIVYTKSSSLEIVNLSDKGQRMKY